MKKSSFIGYKATCVLLAAISLSFTIQAQLSGAYTIDKGNPTSGTNFNSFANAATALGSSGVSGAVTFTVVSNSGPYYEQVLINSITGTSATNTVTFNGNGNKIIATPTSTDLYMVRLNGCSYVTFNNLIIKDSSTTYGWGVHLTGGANYNKITNCTIDLSNINSTSSTTNNGIVFSSSTTSPSASGISGSYNTISGNTIKAGTAAGMYYGIRLNGATTSTGCEGNIILNNSILDGYIYQIYLYYTDNTIVDGNDISRPTKVTVSSFYGIYTSTGCLNSVIRNNKIHNTHDAASSLTGLVGALYASGCDATSSNPNKWYNNLVYNINCNGTVYGAYNSSSDYAQYYFNTFSLDDANSTAGSTYGFYQTTLAAGIEVVNNNVSITRGGSGVKYGCYFSTNTSSILSDKNNLYLNSLGSGSQNTGYWSATGYASLNDWKGANSNAFDQNSVATDPLYSNPSGGVFKPASATMNNIGVAITGITTDILSVTRNTTSPDPGAYEYTPAQDDAGIAQITGPIAPCPGTALVTVELKNFGAATLDSVRIHWTVNGTPQPTVYYSSSINSGNSTVVSLGNITVTGSSVQNIKAWTSNPNGSSDANHLNDTSSLIGLESAMSGTYTIGISGDFSNLVSAASNLNNRGVCGPVVFNVSSTSGPYTGALGFNEINGASATNTITFNGNGAVITDTTDATRYWLVLLNGTDYLTLDSFSIVNTGATYGIGVLLTNKADYNTIKSCNIDISSVLGTGSTTGGIALTGSLTSPATSGDNGNNNTFINNVIDGGTLGGGIYYGIRLNGLSGVPSNIGNKVINNTLKNIYIYNIYAIYGDDILIEGNDITRESKVLVTTFYGIYLSTGCINTTIRNNRIHNTHDNATTTSGSIYGIYTSADATSGNENLIYNNMLYNFNGTSSTIYCVYNSGADFTEYYYNTISLDYSLATSGTTYAFYQPSAASNVVIKNNVFSITRGGTSAKYGFYFSSTSTNQVSDNNIIYMNSAGSGAQYHGYWGAAVNSFSDWQAINSGAFDQNSDSINPEFRNIQLNDYKPNSAGINNTALPVSGITVDIDKVVRNILTPDPGALEFTPIPSNDSCSQAITITAGTTLGSTLGATRDFAPTCVVSDDNSGGVWYKYITTGDFVTASLCGSGFDTRIRAFVGDCSGLVCVDGNEDFCSTQSQISGCADSGIVVYLLVYGNLGAEGNFTLTITEDPVQKATISLSGPSSFCDGDSVVLTAGTNASYLWNDSLVSTAQSITVFNSGTFRVITTDSNGCYDTSSFISTVAFTPVPAVITPNGPATFCQGQSVTLSSNAASIYSWNDSTMSTSQSIVVSKTGSYIVTTTDVNGCLSTSSPINTVVNPLPLVDLGNDTVICNGVSITIDAGSGFNTYSWNVGGTGQTLSFTESTAGSYPISVTVADSNGCQNLDEIIITVEICSGISELSHSGSVSIYPNPAHDVINILLTDFISERAEISIFDFNGRRVYFDNISTQGRQTINLTDLEHGVYMMNVVADDHISTIKLMVK